MANTALLPLDQISIANTVPDLTRRVSQIVTYLNDNPIGEGGSSNSALESNNSLHLNGQSGDYYTNASNLGTGTLPDDRLSANVVTLVTPRVPRTVLAGPATGTTNAAPTFRALAAADVDNLDSRWPLTNRIGFGASGNAQTTISFNPATYTFTLTDITGGSGWTYLYNGLQYTIVGNRTAILPGTPPSNTGYYISLDPGSGTLSVSTTAWTYSDSEAVLPVAYVLWNTGATPQYLLADERHSAYIDRSVHRLLHFSVGAQVLTGGVLSGYTLNGTTDVENTFAISALGFADEDIAQTFSALADPNGTANAYTIAVRANTSAWTWAPAPVALPYSGAGYIQWDNGGTMTAGTTGNFYNTYVIATNLGGIVIVSGRGEFSSAVGAYAETPSSFDWTGFGHTESRVLYQLTWEALTGLATKGKVRLNRVQRVNAALSITTSANTSLTSHSSLADLQGGQPGEYYHLKSAELLDIAYKSNNVTFTANLNVSGIISGNGSGLTSVSADTALVANNALNFDGHSGAYYTNASNMSSGTLPDARLSANVARRDEVNTFQANNYFLGTANVAGTLGVNSAVTFANTLAVTGATTLTGLANLLSTLRVSGAANALSTLGVTGAATLANTLDVTGATTLTGLANLLSTLRVSGAANALSTLGVTGAVTLANTLNVTGLSTLTTANITSTLNVVGATTLANTLGVTGAATLSNTLGVTGATTLSNTLHVAGTANVVGNANVAGTLGVVGAVALSNTLTITGFVNALSTLRVSGAVNALSTLGVTGAATLANTLNVTGLSTLTNANVTANLNVVGVGTFANTLTVTGAVTFSNTANIAGLTTLGTGAHIQNYNYASQTTGWRIDTNGAADFRYLFVDEMYAKAFITDLVRATSGSEILAKSVAMLYADYNIQAAGGANTVFVVRDLPSATGMGVFENSDWVRFRTFSRAAGSLTIADAWGQVTLDTTYGTAGFDSTTKTQRWSFYRPAANSGTMGATTLLADSIVLDYGTSNSGILETTVVDGMYGNLSPYMQASVWQGAAGPQGNMSVRMRVGKLDGLWFGGTNEWGLYAGDGDQSNTGQYIRASSNTVELRNANLRIMEGANTVFYMSRNAGAPYFAMGNPVPPTFASGTGVWMGNDAGTYKFRVGDPTASRISWDGTTFSIIGAVEANTGNIGGWQINATSIYKANSVLSSNGYIAFGPTPPAAYGDNVGAWLGYDSGAKFSLYANADNYLKWTGTNLLISTNYLDIDANGNLTVTGGTITGATIQSSVSHPKIIQFSNTITSTNSTGGSIWTITDSGFKSFLPSTAYDFNRGFVFGSALTGRVGVFGYEGAGERYISVENTDGDATGNTTRTVAGLTTSKGEVANTTTGRTDAYATMQSLQGQGQGDVRVTTVNSNNATFGAQLYLFTSNTSTFSRVYNTNPTANADFGLYNDGSSTQLAYYPAAGGNVSVRLVAGGITYNGGSHNINGTVYANGIVFAHSTMTVNGEVTFANTLTVAGLVFANGNMTALGNTEFSQTGKYFSVGGYASFANSVTIDGSATISGILTVNSSMQANGTLTVHNGGITTGNGDIQTSNGHLRLTKSNVIAVWNSIGFTANNRKWMWGVDSGAGEMRLAVLSEDESVSNSVVIFSRNGLATGNVSFYSPRVSFNNNVAVTSWATIGSLQVGTINSTGSFTSTGSANVGGALYVGSSTTLNGGLIVNLASAFYSTLTVNGAANLYSTLTVNGATTLSNTLYVTGASTFGNTANVIGLLTTGQINVAPGYAISIGEHRTHERVYSANTSTPATLLDYTGASFDVTKTYRVTATTVGTSSETGAQAVFTGNGTAFVLKNSVNYFKGSNNPEFFLNAGVPSVRLWSHATLYSVRVLCEEYPNRSRVCGISESIYTVGANNFVGIHTGANTRMALEVVGTKAAPVSLSTAVDGSGIFMISDGIMPATINAAVVMGIATSTYYGYLQARNAGAVGVPYNFALNPLGGGVSIGMSGGRMTQGLEIAGTLATPTLAAPIATGTLMISDGSNVGMVMGSYGSPYHSYIQARNFGTASTPYTLALNPLGGAVGIGTAVPSGRFSIVGGYASTGQIAVPGNGLAIGTAGSSPNAAQIMWGDVTGWQCHFGGVYANGQFSPTMTVQDNGRVGIGTTTPGAYRLQVHAANSAWGQYVSSAGSSGANYGLLLDAGTTSADWSILARTNSGSNVFGTRGDGRVAFYGGSATEGAAFSISSARPTFDLNSGAWGNLIAGTTLGLGRNTSNNGAAGNIAWYRKDGNIRITWVDAADQFRIHTAAPHTNDASTDTLGTVVGTQTSNLAAKDILRVRTDVDALLRVVLNAPIADFQYKETESGQRPWNGETFTGIVTDWTPEFGMDRGKSLNTASAIGHLVGAIQAISARLDAIESRLTK